MDLDQLRYVLAIDRSGGFTRAAEECFVAQPALSRRVASLERELGTALFARSSRRVELTEAGRAFLPEARACLAAAERARQAADDRERPLTGPLRIGLVPTPTRLDLPGALATMRERHPGLGVSLTTAGSNELIADLVDDRLDLALLGLPEGIEPGGVSTRVIARERLDLLVPPGHPLLRRDRIHLADLTAESFVDFPAGTSGRRQGDLAFRAAGVTREVSFEVVEAGVFCQLIARGLGIGFLPPGLPGAADLVPIAVADAPRRSLQLAWREFNPGRVALEFAELLASQAEDPGPASGPHHDEGGPQRTTSPI